MVAANLAARRIAASGRLRDMVVVVHRRSADIVALVRHNAARWDVVAAIAASDRPRDMVAVVRKRSVDDSVRRSAGLVHRNVVRASAVAGLVRRSAGPASVAVADSIRAAAAGAVSKASKALALGVD